MILDNKTREFIGFVLGEGCITLIRQRARRYSLPTYVPKVQVSIRSDDDEILIWAKEKYGGSLRRFKGRWEKQNPFSVWSINTLSSVINFLEEFLNCELPSKKIEQAKLLLEVCKKKKEITDRGHKGKRRRWYTDEEIKYQDDTYLKLRELKKYKVQ